MLGHKQIVALRKKRHKPRAIFVFIAPHPPSDDPELAVLRGEIPIVYTGATNPRRADLTWAKGLTIQLLAMGCGIEEFTQWWIALVDAEPKFLLGLDFDGEINIWRG